MNLAAIQHFAFDNYCYPLNEDEIEINLRTGKEVQRVILVWGDPFAAGILGGDWQWNGTELEITEKKELQQHFLWTVTVKPQFKRLSYYFKLLNEGDEYYFTHDGIFTKKEFETAGIQRGRFTFPWLNSADICKVPEWVQKTVWYQIFPARFCRGKSNVTPENLIPWAEYGAEVPHERRKPEPVYGGNLQGIIDKLDYLQELGITGIYTTPLNKSPSQHKYNTVDYEMIDPEFGDKALMKEFVQKAHEHGIKVMLDGVFNHSGWEWPFWQDVWEKREKSEYKDWFMVNDFNFDQPDWGYGKGNAGKGKFYSFAFVDWMPKLNTNNPKVREYVLEVCKKWIKEYDIDGLRLDVANEISHVLCQEMNAKLKEIKPDFYIVGEIWHNSQPWLRGQEFDSVMNYPLQIAIANFCCKDILNAKEFEYAINRCYSMYYRQVNRVLFNQMDSHDTIRILNRCDGNKTRAKQALALLFAMAGSACIYYGTEILLAGGHDPDNRRCMPWKEIEEGQFAEEFKFMQTLISLRKNYSSLSSTKYQFVNDEANQNGQGRIVHLVKYAEDSNEKIEIIINCENDKIPAENIPAENILLKDKGMLIFKS